jgi:hypothetical protein
VGIATHRECRLTERASRENKTAGQAASDGRIGVKRNVLEFACRRAHVLPVPGRRAAAVARKRMVGNEAERLRPRRHGCRQMS